MRPQLRQHMLPLGLGEFPARNLKVMNVNYVCNHDICKQLTLALNLT